MKTAHGLVTESLLAFLVWQATAFAEGPMTIAEAVERALAAHPSLKTAAARVHAAEAARGVLWESYAPQVTLFGGVQANRVSGNTTTTTTSSGLFGSTSAVTRSFSASDTEVAAGGNVEEFLFDFGAFSAERRSAEERRDAQAQALETQRLDVALATKVAYCTLLRARRFLQYNQDAVDQRRKLVGRLASAAGRDASQRKDLLQAELELANGLVSLGKSENEASEAEASLSEALGDEPGTPHSLVDDVTLKVMLLDLRQAIDRALAIRPELEQARAVVRAQESEVDAAWAGYFPRFSTYLNVTSLTPVTSSSLHQLTVIGGGLAVRVPTTLLVSTDRLHQAEASLQEAKAREEELRRSIGAAVTRAYQSLRETADRVRVTTELTEHADRNWTETRARERKGLVSEAERAAAYAFAYDARVSLAQALYDAKIAEGRLERAIGADF